MKKKVRPSGVGRLEAFSDAVLAIVLTLLVLDLLPHVVQTPSDLLEAWPTYLAYLGAFVVIGITWLNHNQQMSRLRRANPIVQALNLLLLLGTSLVPWPTALMAVALQHGNRADQIAAVVVFAVVTVIISVPWLVLDLYLAGHPTLLNSAEDVTWMRAHARISIGTLIAAPVSVAVAFLSPIASLVIYVAVGVAFAVLRLRETDDDLDKLVE